MSSMDEQKCNHVFEEDDNRPVKNGDMAYIYKCRLCGAMDVRIVKGGAKRVGVLIPHRSEFQILGSRRYFQTVSIPILVLLALFLVAAILIGLWSVVWPNTALEPTPTAPPVLTKP